MKNALEPNSLGNNSPLRPKKIAAPFLSSEKFQIKELELSLNTKCNLRCSNCGFKVPNQPEPFNNDMGIEQHIDSLLILKNIGVRIGKIVLVGGEISLHKDLNSDIKKIKEVMIAGQLEVVTNGLYPQGIDSTTLELIDSLVISDYVRTEDFESIWEQYAGSLRGEFNISFRRKDFWDDWNTPVSMSADAAQTAWSTCFYRNYDITLERGRLFSCSRIAKNRKENEGLNINDIQDISDVETYLNSTTPRPSCSTCSPVAGLPEVIVAQQDDGKEVALSRAAIRHMEQSIQGVRR
ncbi:radical SAM protein [uncultured Amphritea sp.]|uniref:radical SAM protein n=1 Tax=uncultured Amphritea sp. TaxID=981605 RepID=UPI00262D4F00|nr:radical SAM protein [uncultured Amphritea sp.]